MPSGRRTLLWLKPQYLGDAVMALPVVDAVAGSGRTAVVRAQSSVLAMMADRASRDEQVAVGKFSGMAGLFRSVSQLRSMRLAEAILFDRSFRSALAVRLAGIPVRVGHDTEGRGFLLTHRCAYDARRNETECFADLAQRIGISVSDRIPKLAVQAEERVEAGRWFEAPALAIQPGARYASKRFPIDRLAGIAAQVAEGLAIVLVGGPDEIESAEEFRNEFDRPVIDLVGKTSLRESMAVLAGCRAAVGSDTGLMHVAAALGVPTVTLFGPNPASKWGHDYPPHHVLAAPEGDWSRLPSRDVLAAVRRALTLEPAVQ